VALRTQGEAGRSRYQYYGDDDRRRQTTALRLFGLPLLLPKLKTFAFGFLLRFGSGSIQYLSSWESLDFGTSGQGARGPAGGADGWGSSLFCRGGRREVVGFISFSRAVGAHLFRAQDCTRGPVIVSTYTLPRSFIRRSIRRSQIRIQIQISI